jgi:cephalosporin hydroxylase
VSYESEFELQIRSNIERMGKDMDLQGLSRIWIREIIPYKYTYNFKWLGQPIMQTPQDIIAWQELI